MTAALERSEARRAPSELASAALGVWLCVSAFLWPHSRGEIYIACIAGGAITLLALGAWAALPWLRWGNATLATLLFLATILVPHEDGGTVLNQIFVSLAVLTLSFIPLPLDDEILASWSVPPTPDV